MSRNALTVIAIVLAVALLVVGYMWYQDQQRSSVEISVGEEGVSIDAELGAPAPDSPPGESMPYVNIRVTGTATPEQKSQVYEEVTATLSRVLGKDPAGVYIIFEEIDPVNWGARGKSVAELQAK